MPGGSALIGQSVEVTASLIGRATRSRTIRLQAAPLALDFTLAADPLELEGVVVTALGIQRQARAVGVATQTVMGDDLVRSETNLVDALSGKAAGVHITSTGPQGGSSRIVVRGENSISGANQPLFVVDGIPVDNSTGYRVGVLTDSGGLDFGNAVQDIQSAGIASITVLKGPNAAALYGSRASNGAVIIETRRGADARGGSEVVVSQTVTFEDELRLPRYQDKYGQGLSGEFSYFDGNDNGVFDGQDQSWGPPLDVGLMIPQWDSPLDPTTGDFMPTPWVSHPDNVDQFFEVGTTTTTDVSVAGFNDRAHGRGALSRTDFDGMVPGMSLERTSLSFAGGVRANDRLGIASSVRYVRSKGENRPGVGFGEDNPMYQFIWFGRQVDMTELNRRYDQVRPDGDPMAGLPYSWNTSFHPNPYFLQLANTNTDERDRLIGQISATYQLNSWLNATVRSATDWYQDDRIKRYARNPQVNFTGHFTTNPLTASFEHLTANGGFGKWDIGFQETNTDFLLNANPALDLPFSASFAFGGNRRDVERDVDYTWVGELASPGTFDVANAAATPERNTILSRRRVNSLYGVGELGYNDYLFLTVTGRNDWSSTLPEESRSYFYPSLSGSFIFTDALPGLRIAGLEYGKLRASWARVGNDTDPYSLRNTFVADEIWDGLPSFSLPSELANAELRPETTESFEVGAELALLGNRLGLDLTYYREETRDQIMPVQLSRATGYQGRIVNAGTVQNRGWEAVVRAIPVQTSRFRWAATLNWSKNDNEVVELAEGVEGLELSLRNVWGTSLFARKGEPLGQLVGAAYRRDPQGNIVVHAGLGVPLWTNTPEVIGNANPDWRASLSNEFTMGRLRFRFLLDGRQGGEIFSVTSIFGRNSGVLEETLAGRCTPAGNGGEPPPGYPVCTRETGIVFDGVNAVSGDGGTTYVPNETVVDAQTLWSFAFLVPEAHIEDASYLKLREVALSYDLPESLTGRFRLDGATLSLIGRNLHLWARTKHIDPETSAESSNVQGFEYGQIPSARSIGLTLTIRP